MGTLGVGDVEALRTAVGLEEKAEGAPPPQRAAAPASSSGSMASAEETVVDAVVERERVLVAVERVLDEWLVTGIHRAASLKFIRDKICGSGGGDECQRVRQWLLLRVNNRIWDHGEKLMCRTPENVPGLRAMPVWPREATPWLAEVEARHGEILQELLAARGGAQGGLSGFQPYRDPASSGNRGRVPTDGVGVEGVDSGMWNVLYLYLNHKSFEDNCERFPVTVRAINEVYPRQYSHAFISALTPGSHIIKHTGPSNRMLRVWLPLCGLDGFRLRVGDTIVHPKAGQAFAWDHSFEHEAWHDGEETRFVLIVDIWHPDLTEPEVRFLSALQNCRLRAGRVLAEQAAMQGAAEGGEPKADTYFEIVERARHLLTDDDWWIVRAECDPTTRPT